LKPLGVIALTSSFVYEYDGSTTFEQLKDEGAAAAPPFASSQNKWFYTYVLLGVEGRAGYFDETVTPPS
jgi:hypothetical protein